MYPYNFTLATDGIITGIAPPDFPERKKINKIKSISEDVFLKAFMHCPSLMMLFSISDNTIAAVNERFIRKIKIRRNEVIGHSIDKLLIYIRQKDLAALKKLFINGQVIRNYEIKLTGKTGRKIIGSISWEFITVEAGRYLLVMMEDVTETQELQKKILDTVEMELQVIGHDIHDELGQNLTCASFLIQSLKQDQYMLSAESASQLEKIDGLIRNTIRSARNIAKMLSPYDNSRGGLLIWLNEMVSQIEDIFPILCRVEQKGIIAVHDENIATNLYYIAREAVNNALKHSKADNIIIFLEQESGNFKMKITDNGTGTDPSEKKRGMGLRIMKYRAGIIGARLEYKGELNSGFSVEVNITL